MTISEQIKVLCVRSDISVAELARRIGTSPQNLKWKNEKRKFYDSRAGRYCAGCKQLF